MRGAQKGSNFGVICTVWELFFANFVQGVFLAPGTPPGTKTELLEARKFSAGSQRRHTLPPTARSAQGHTHRHTLPSTARSAQRRGSQFRENQKQKYHYRKNANRLNSVYTATDEWLVCLRACLCALRAVDGSVCLWVCLRTASSRWKCVSVGVSARRE